MIYCDMDGVIVDLEKRLQEISKSISKNRFSDDVWCEVAKLGPSFWIDLHWISDGIKLWTYLKSLNKEIKILSGLTTRNILGLRDSCALGKSMWIENNIYGTEYIFCLPTEKRNYVLFEDILIDDNDKNISDWCNNGGIGILHTDANNTISCLNLLLK